MSKPTQWPVSFKENLIIGNLKSSVGVATLWTPKELFEQQLQKDSYCVLGQLYSNDGINPILRNVLARPQIHTIILCGQDKIGSADSLTKLVKNGVSKNRSVIGKKEAKVEKEIPKRYIDLFRKNITIIDKRGELKAEKIQKEIEKHQEKNTPWAKPKLFREPQFETEFFPTDPHGIKIRDKDIAHAWLRIVFAVMRFGKEKKSHHGTTQKELLNMMSIITEEDPEEMNWAEWFPFTKKHLKAYLPQVMSKKPLKGVEYTYGSRLRDHNGINQIETMIQKIKEEYFTRRALAITWNVQKDDQNPLAPCLDLVQAIVQDDQLHLTVYFRSNDMFRAWPENAYAIRTMHKEIATGTEIEMGETCIISQSAHIYEENYDEAKELLDKYYTTETDFCRFDTRGNFVIDIDHKKNTIIMTMLDPRGEKIAEFKAKTAMKLLHQLTKHEAVSEIGHAIDLGLELFKAETCLRTGLMYQQDLPGTYKFYKELQKKLQKNQK